MTNGRNTENVHGQQAAALDALGAAMGSVGLAGFAFCGVEIGGDLERVFHLLAALSVGRGWSLCFAAQALFPVFNTSPGFGGPLHAENAILLAQMPVVIDKEFLQLLDKFLA